MTRRSLMMVGAVGGIVALSSAPVRAQLATLDLTNLIQNTSTALNTAQQVRQFIQQLEMTARQLEADLDNLRQLNPTTFQGVLDTFNYGRMTYDSYMGTQQAIRYQAGSVRQNFETLFPGATRARTANPREQAGRAADRMNEVHGAAAVAMAAQANEDKLKENARIAKNIAAKSRTAEGTVGQMQLMLEGLLLIQNQLTVLTQMLSASERLKATESANTSSSAMLGAELNKRTQRDYTNRGRAVAVKRKLP